MNRTLEDFAHAVGPEGPVTVVGGRTRWEVGGPLQPGVREVRAPSGVVTHEPSEMTVRAGAGTTVADLHAVLGAVGQTTILPEQAGSTIGGVLAVGHSGIERLGWGPVRDAVLEVRLVNADGELVKGGGPTVKNVSGYDLPRLFVGSLGLLGLLGEVVLRTRPLPRCRRWYHAPGARPASLRAALYRPLSLLWDGTDCWVQLEGHPDDVEAQVATAGAVLVPVPGPPPLPPQRWSIDPASVEAALTGPPEGEVCVAEYGVGVLHRHQAPPPVVPDPAVGRLHQRLRAAFDPTGRFSPGRSVLP